MSNHQELQTIDPAALAQVSGGVAQVPPTTQDPILTALSSILDSIHTLAAQQNNSGGFNQQEMLMLMMMMQQRNQQAAAAAASTWSSWSQQPIVHYY